MRKLILKYFNYCIVTLRPMPDVITDTNRYYSAEVLKKAVDEYIKTKVNKKRAVCELSLGRDNVYYFLETDLRNVSHMISKIWKWKGKYKALTKVMHRTPAGGILKSLLLDNNFNLRGVGSIHVNENLNGSVKVNDDLRIISWDASSIGLKTKK